jgi:hypothetical protein
MRGLESADRLPDRETSTILVLLDVLSCSRAWSVVRTTWEPFQWQTLGREVEVGVSCRRFLIRAHQRPNGNKVPTNFQYHDFG